jgi:hypothetical protein
LNDYLNINLFKTNFILFFKKIIKEIKGYLTISMLGPERTSLHAWPKSKGLDSYKPRRSGLPTSFKKNKIG